MYSPMTTLFAIFHAKALFSLCCGMGNYYNILLSFYRLEFYLTKIGITICRKSIEISDDLAPSHKNSQKIRVAKHISCNTKLKIPESSIRIINFRNASLLSSAILQISVHVTPLIQLPLHIYRALFMTYNLCIQVMKSSKINRRLIDSFINVAAIS